MTERVTGGRSARPPPRPALQFGRGDPAAADRRQERLPVALGLVGLGEREIADRGVERGAAARISGDQRRDRGRARASVRPHSAA